MQIVGYMPDGSSLMRSRPHHGVRSTAYQALLRISSIYKIEESLKELTSEERLKARKQSIAPLIDEYFDWIKNQSLQNQHMRVDCLKARIL